MLVVVEVFFSWRRVITVTPSSEPDVLFWLLIRFLWLSSSTTQGGCFASFPCSQLYRVSIHFELLLLLIEALWTLFFHFSSVVKLV